MRDKIRSDEQRRKFIEAARALGCDEDEAAFKTKLAVIARQKPKDEDTVSKPSLHKNEKA